MPRESASGRARRHGRGSCAHGRCCRAGLTVPGADGLAEMAPSTTGINESDTYAYSFAQSEKIRQIMKHKEAKLKEEEEQERFKNGTCPLLSRACPCVARTRSRVQRRIWLPPCAHPADGPAAWRVSRASIADLNKEILDEADQEEALGGFMTSDASPLSLLTGGSAMPYASNGSVALSAGPWGYAGSAAPAGRVPTAIVNGQPVFSGTADPFGGTLRGSALPVMLPFRPADRVSRGKAPRRWALRARHARILLVFARI